MTCSLLARAPRFLMAFTLTCILALAGCQRSEVRKKIDELRGPGFADANWSRNLRPADSDRQEPSGFSTKARQVESNLGIR